MKRISALTTALLCLIVLAGCAGTNTEDTSVKNPMAEYGTVPEITDKLGFEPAELPEVTGFHLDKMYIIGSTVASLEYKNDAGASATVRTAKDTDTDINGYQGVDYQKRSADGREYYFGSFEDGKAYTGYIDKDGIRYGLSAEGVDEGQFNDMMSYMITTIP